jgi:diadenosine tetraphosphate (Ap4A) HIT family hydrolase
MADYALHPVLDADTLPIGRLPLCEVRLMDDARFPWLILVPASPGLVEIVDLDAAGRARLMEEIAGVSDALKRLFRPDKLNVAALGNEVPQLHVHVIARFVSDAAWPKPVFGQGERTPYPPHSAGALCDSIRRGLAPMGIAP